MMIREAAIDEDIALLRQGQPPENNDLLKKMTQGDKVWLDRFYEHYLENYILKGGSKVKVLVGPAGSGKTHLLRCIENRANESGYATVYYSSRDIYGKLSDIRNLYHAIATSIDYERLIKGLCLKVAEEMGYSHDRYNGAGRLLPLVIEDGLNRYDAEREIRNAVGRSFRDVDFGPSFSTFAFTVTRDRLVEGRVDGTLIALKWLRGEKLERHEKQAGNLFETLQKTNARYWLNSLVRLLNVAAMKGLVVLVDDIEVLTERDRETGRFLYTPNQVKDTCELFRQMIDDVELLNGFLLVLAGKDSVIEDERRGLKSYEALWMRLQTGLVPSDRFNPLADIVDTNKHLAAQGFDFPQSISAHLIDTLKDVGYERRYREPMPDLDRHNALRAAVMDVALMSERVDNYERLS